MERIASLREQNNIKQPELGPRLYPCDRPLGGWEVRSLGKPVRTQLLSCALLLLSCTHAQNRNHIENVVFRRRCYCLCI